MKYVLLILALLGASGCVSAQPPYSELEPKTGQLLNGESLCSATTLYRHAIATTKHCVIGAPKQLRYQGVLVNVTGYLYDETEGVIVLVDRDLGQGVGIGPLPRVGDEVSIIGNPAAIEQVIRRATYAGVGEYPDTGKPFMWIDCRCWSGDSGAGVLDSKGRLVGIFWGALRIHYQDKLAYPVEFYFSIAYPLSFTDGQIKQAREYRPQ